MVITGKYFGFRDRMKIKKQDADCNPSNAMAVLGVIKGFSRLPKDFRKAVQNMGDTLFIHTNYSFNKAVKQTIKYAAKLAVQNGGVATDNELIIKIQKPQPLKLEVTFPKLVFDHRATVFEKDGWKFKGNWMKYSPRKGLNIK
jgi:hypothetical protein